MIEALVQYGTDVNSRGQDSVTPLAILVRCRESYPSSVDTARYLIEMGADVDAEDKQGVRIVEYAMTQNNAPLVQYLLDIGVELRLKPPAKECSSIIHATAMRAGIEICDILKNLVHQGYFLDLENHLVDSWGFTPWHYFEKLRYDYAFGDRQNYEAEKEKFTELMDEIARAISPKPVNLFGPRPPHRETPIKRNDDFPTQPLVESAHCISTLCQRQMGLPQSRY
jgi:hypothetical protein